MTRRASTIPAALLAICRVAAQQERPLPSSAAMADMLGCSISRVNFVLGQLHDEGWITLINAGSNRRRVTVDEGPVWSERDIQTEF